MFGLAEVSLIKPSTRRAFDRGAEAVGAGHRPIAGAGDRIGRVEQDAARIEAVDAVDRIRSRRILAFVEMMRTDLPRRFQPHRGGDVPQRRYGGGLEAADAFGLVLDHQTDLTPRSLRPDARRAFPGVAFGLWAARRGSNRRPG